VVADLEARVLQEPRRIDHVLNRMAPLDELVDIIIDVLDAQLDPGHPEPQKPVDLGGVQGVGAGLHRDAHVADRCPLCEGTSLVQGVQASMDEGLLVLGRGGRERAPHHDEIDLVHLVAYGPKLLDAARGLPEGVILVLGAPHGGRLVAGVALGDPVVGAARAVGAPPVGAGPGLSHHCDDVDPAQGASLLSPQDVDEAGPLLGIEGRYDLGVPRYAGQAVLPAHLDLDPFNVPPVGGRNGEKPLNDKPEGGLQLGDL